MIEKGKTFAFYGHTTPGRNEISEEIAAVPLEYGECCHRRAEESRNR
jgi:hypothetical protein